MLLLVGIESVIIQVLELFEVFVKGFVCPVLGIYWRKNLDVQISGEHLDTAGRPSCVGLMGYDWNDRELGIESKVNKSFLERG